VFELDFLRILGPVPPPAQAPKLYRRARAVPSPTTTMTPPARVLVMRKTRRSQRTEFPSLLILRRNFGTDVGSFNTMKYERGDDALRKSRTASSSFGLPRILCAPKLTASPATNDRWAKAAPLCGYIGPGHYGEAIFEASEEVMLCCIWDLVFDFLLHRVLRL
jgi:hypothetical protein